MIAATVLLTPLMLAAEPTRLNVPDQTYDHATQVSTFIGDQAVIRKISSTQTVTRGDGFRTNDYDGDWN